MSEARLGEAARKPSTTTSEEAARTAHRPAGAGETSEAFRRDEARHHGVVEHRRDLDRDCADREGNEGDGDAVGRTGRGPPERGRAEDESNPAAAIHGFLGLLASAMAPRTGDRHAKGEPAAAGYKAQRLCPVTASGASAAAK